ncbi:hypothetical protein LINPERPRIM_LOCUS10327 [Linum perenne]
MKAISAVESHHHFLHPKKTHFPVESQYSQLLLLSVNNNHFNLFPQIQLRRRRRNLVLTHSSRKPLHQGSSTSRSRALETAAGASIGLLVFWMFVDEHSSKALALGPLMEEEFWDNVRRYALYALTVSTGALYTILVPIVELLKNPISAILVLVILFGGFYIVSQVVSAMVGLSDFSYSYSY